MNKIEQGIQINNQHVQNVINRVPEQMSFYEQIINLGFEDLEDFFKQKSEYEMQQCLKGKIYNAISTEGLDILGQLIQDQQYGIVSVDNDIIFIYQGNNVEKQINTEYCEQNNIPIKNYGTFGGSIVVSPGDYSIAILLPSSIDVNNNFFLGNIANILKKYFSNVIIDNNDILIDNKKILGSAAYSNERYFFFVAHFSFSSNRELIQNICGNISDDGKQPGYIDSNILSVEQLKEELLKWLQGL